MNSLITAVSCGNEARIERDATFDLPNEPNAGIERLGAAAAADGAAVVDEHRHRPGRDLDVGAQPDQGGVATDWGACQRKSAAAQVRKACRNTRDVVGKLVRPAEASLGDHPHGVAHREAALRSDRDRALGAAQRCATYVLRQRSTALRHTAQVKIEATEAEAWLDQPRTKGPLHADAEAAAAGQAV